MGIAKTMNAIGDYDFYNKDYTVFVKIISAKFNINIRVYFIDMTSTYDDIDRAINIFEMLFKIIYSLE